MMKINMGWAISIIAMVGLLFNELLKWDYPVLTKILLVACVFVFPIMFTPFKKDRGDEK